MSTSESYAKARDWGSKLQAPEDKATGTACCLLRTSGTCHQSIPGTAISDLSQIRKSSTTQSRGSLNERPRLFFCLWSTSKRLQANRGARLGCSLLNDLNERPDMSLRAHPTQDQTPTAARSSPEIHHPRPTRPPDLQRRVTISAVTEEQQSPTWPHYVPANAALNSEKVTESSEVRPAETSSTRIQRSPSAPPALNHPPPTPTTIHPILAVRSILRSRSRMHLAWDVRFSPDAPAPLATRSQNRYSTGTLAATTTSSIGTQTRPRSNTQPTTELQLASDLNARLNFNYNSHPAGTKDDTPVGQVFADHPMALEPATTPSRRRMLIVCRDLLPWLIPVYARDLEVGCTVLDVVRGVYTSLQTPVEVAGQMRSDSGEQSGTVRRRVEWLREKTLFVCLARDEALARRRLPGRESLWGEVFVLMLARRER